MSSTTDRKLFSKSCIRLKSFEGDRYIICAGWSDDTGWFQLVFESGKVGSGGFNKSWVIGTEHLGVA